MTRFHCLGAECEGTCCAGVAVPVDQASHVRLKVFAQTDAVARELVERAVVLTPQGPGYGELRFESGNCAMLDPSGLCRIHARFGNDGLFEVCATYPRYFSRIDAELELYGTLSCPEVARLVLLDDDAFEQSEEPDQHPRKLRNSFETSAPYYRPFRQVREGLLKVLDAPGQDVRTRLFALLWVSDKLRPVLHDKCGPVLLAEVEGALQTASRAGMQAQLGATLRELAIDKGLLHSITSHVLERSESVNGLARAAEIPAWVRERLESYLARYAKNCVLTTPYMLFPSLFAYVSDLVLKVALLRAELERRLAGFTGSEEDLARTVVAVVFRFVRRLEHTDVVGRVSEQLAAQGLNSFAHTVCLL
ncbi:MAG TPA: flagellin lysine-N-methylase [Polyangiaceae bacterium]